MPPSRSFSHRLNQQFTPSSPVGWRKRAVALPRAVYDVGNYGQSYLAIALWLASWQAPLVAYDFSALTALAHGALTGENVNRRVPGFEIRLLQEGEAIFHEAYGDWAVDQPARTDSSTKTITGAVMMSLAETKESGFSLDSRLSEYLVEYQRTELRDITIRQTLSHTSGMASQGPTSLILADPNLTLRQAAHLISFKPQDNGPPGSTFAYGGLSMQVAGAAAEVATGEPYVEIFTERIVAPLMMTNTQFVSASLTNPRLAGGVESTASDYARFMDMLLNGGVDRETKVRVLQAESVEEMLSLQTNDSQSIEFSPVDNHRYGIGVWLDQLGEAGPNVDVLAGGARGFHSWIDQSRRLVFTFATDLTTASNVELLSSAMHAAILEAVSMPGDFDFDGHVDGEDFLRWQRGSLAGPLGEVDLENWKANFGFRRSQSSTSSVVAEPEIAVMVSTCVLTVLCGAKLLRTRIGVSVRNGAPATTL